MRIKIEPHRDYQCLQSAEATALYDTAKRLLRVGFEIEFNVPGSRADDQDEAMSSVDANDVLLRIQEQFEKRYGFTMAIGKNVNNMKKVKRTFSDGNTRIEVPIEVEIDGYLEHLMVPYGYFDGSTPIELVTSPVEPSIGKVRDILSKVFDTVESLADTRLEANCLRNCGLHQTVVFEHLKPSFPEIVVANAVQITRAYIPGLYYLLSAGNRNTPSRSTRFRNHNPSIWTRSVLSMPKYSAVYPRYKSIDRHNTEYWGIEFRYPDGTRSLALAGAMAVLNTAIVLKAIKLSRYGVVKISDDYYQSAKAAVVGFTTTGSLTDEQVQSPNFFPRLIAEGLVKFLSEEILDTDRSAYPLVHQLLKQPLWSRFSCIEDMALERYRDIDAELFASAVLDAPPESDKAKVQMAVETDYCTARDRRNSVRRVATKLQRTYAETNRLLREQGYIWSSKLAKFVPMEG